MAHKNTKNSAVWKGSHKASLDHWVGYQQHTGTGVSTDPKMKQPVAKGIKRGGEPDAGGNA